nr:hypothetical protein [Cupriavidus sp. YR651]
MTDEELKQVQSFHRRFADEMSKRSPDGANVISANRALHFANYAAARMPILLRMIKSSG